MHYQNTQMQLHICLLHILWSLVITKGNKLKKINTKKKVYLSRELRRTMYTKYLSHYHIQFYKISFGYFFNSSFSFGDHINSSLDIFVLWTDNLKALS